MPSADAKREIVSIVLLLRAARAFDLAAVQRAATDAFRDAPAPPQVVAIKPPTTFGLQLGPISLGVISVSRPYFKDAVAVAGKAGTFAARDAVLDHRAWLSVDFVGEASVSREVVYQMIGLLIGEFLQDDVLGLVRTPHGPVVGYDFSFIPKLRDRKVDEVFTRGTPDRVVHARADDARLEAATNEARRRWPEFVQAFAAPMNGQNFAVKKKFTLERKVEHMWVFVTAIDGDSIAGWLNNTPNILKSMKARDAVAMSVDEVEDWIYTSGRETVGGFQAKVLANR